MLIYHSKHFMFTMKLTHVTEKKEGMKSDKKEFHKNIHCKRQIEHSNMVCGEKENSQIFIKLPIIHKSGI